MTHTYQINGMTCGSCVARVKNELLKLGDVISADVQLKYPQATIEMSRHISTNTLQDAVKRAGNYAIRESDGDHQVKPAVADKVNTSYFPVFLIFGYIILITVLIQAVQGSFHWMQWLGHFMAGFFFIFSFFKFLNLKGFAEGYRSYDIIARVFPAWGFIYPFIELAFAILLLTGLFPVATNIAIFLVMGISCIGVIQTLLRKSSFQCACLGTIIKLPLSKVTLVEDLLMVCMSIGMVIVTIN